jgi:hypothetical protein
MLLVLPFVVLLLAPTDVSWHTDYARACERAAKDKKDLVIYFRDAEGRFDRILAEPSVKRALSRYVCLRLPESYRYRGERLLDHGSLAEMMGRSGLIVASMHDKNLATHGEVISAHPLAASHYGWVPEYGVEQVKVILDLPPTASLTQRSMIYALRVHPEQPRSVASACHPAFLGHADRHSNRQAQMRHQHHADLGAAWNRLASEVGESLGGPSEVVAESWGAVVGGENVLEAAFSCVDAWRHSPGHWGAVSRLHRYFGYDIARGANGTWYATGIFAD